VISIANTATKTEDTTEAAERRISIPVPPSTRLHIRPPRTITSVPISAAIRIDRGYKLITLMSILMGMGIRRHRRAAEEGTVTSRLTGTIAILHPQLRTHRTHPQRASRALVRQGLGRRPRAPAAPLLPRVLLARPREANITATRANANIPHPRTGPRILGKSVRVVGAVKMMRTLTLVDMRGKEDRLVEIILAPLLLLLGLQLLLVVV